MAEDGWGGDPPFAPIIMALVGGVVAAPLVVADNLTDAVAEAIGPATLLLIPLILLLLIRFLSSERKNFITDVLALAGEPNSIHRVGGSPVGVALILLVLLFLVNYRMSIFGGGGDDGGDD